MVKVAGDMPAGTEAQGCCDLRSAQQGEQGLQQGGGIVGGHQPAAHPIDYQLFYPGVGAGHHRSAAGHRLQQAPAGYVGPAEIGMHPADAKQIAQLILCQQAGGVQSAAVNPLAQARQQVLEPAAISRGGAAVAATVAGAGEHHLQLGQALLQCRQHGKQAIEAPQRLQTAGRKAEYQGLRAEAGAIGEPQAGQRIRGIKPQVHPFMQHLQPGLQPGGMAVPLKAAGGDSHRHAADRHGVSPLLDLPAPCRGAITAEQGGGEIEFEHRHQGGGGEEIVEEQRISPEAMGEHHIGAPARCRQLGKGGDHPPRLLPGGK